MGINGQQASRKMTAGPADLAQSQLQILGFENGVRGQEIMDGGVGRDKGQPVGQFETLLA